MLPEIKVILDSFNPVRLEEIDRVRLMDRIDTKYVFPASRVLDLLYLMDGNYSVLEVNGYRISDYTTTYFDYSRILVFSTSMLQAGPVE